jgi:hypothetical protein
MAGMSTSTAIRSHRVARPAARVSRDGRPVPRWARTAAHLVPAVTLPSGLWRVGLVLGLVEGPLADGATATVDGVGNAAAIVAISVVAECAALLTFGLVRPWGERVPAWIPGLAGRRIPPAAVIVPAALGALSLQVIWTFAFVNFFARGLEFSSAGWEAVLVACYAPLLLWAPLLAAVTWAYWRRRRPGGDGTPPRAPGSGR